MVWFDSKPFKTYLVYLLIQLIAQKILMISSVEIRQNSTTMSWMNSEHGLRNAFCIASLQWVFVTESL